jgi:hypothetical protein
VKRRIETLRKMGMAFFGGDAYLLAGVLFTKRHACPADLSHSLRKTLTAL